MDEKPNPYEPPKIPSPPFSPRSGRTVSGLILWALAGAFGTFVLTAPMGAIDGGGEWYIPCGALVCAAMYWFRP